MIGTRVLVCAGLLASLGCGDMLNFAVHTHTDDDCRGATRHLAECCPNFHDGAVSCLYDDRTMSGACAEISRSQAECIQQTPCGAVRSAALGYDFVCGFEMRKSLMRDGGCDRGSIPPKGVKPSEAGD